MADDLAKYLRLTEAAEVIIARHGQPAGALTGFGSQDDGFGDHREHDPAFRNKSARTGLRRGEGVRLEDIRD